MRTARIARLPLLTAAALAGATALAAGSAGAPPLRGVNFISVCGFSHRGPDDPIVLPRQPGYSHDHTFVGNTSTDAFSTPARLRAAGTTCRRSADTAAYWMPTLLVGGQPVVPTVAQAYYRRLTTTPVKPFPVGMQIIGGNSHATAPQSLLVTNWDCGDLVNIPASSSVPQCTDGSLSLHVDFPNCWDGKTILWDGGKHETYSVNSRCPRGYPTPLPALELVYRYPVTTTTADVELASGGQYSGHADFINTWDQPVLASLVAKCLNRYRHCATGS